MLIRVACGGVPGTPDARETLFEKLADTAMTDLVYSTTLLAATMLAAASVVWGLVMLVKKRRRWFPAVAWTATAAGVLAGVSQVVHLRYGHGTGSPEPMNFAIFLGHHPAYGVVAGMVTAALVTSFVVSRTTPR